jgi:hypothetical protein
MKLHANAALSLNQRRRLAGRVVEEGWSLTEAATAAEVSEAPPASGSPATEPRASLVCSIVPRGRDGSTTERPRRGPR